MVKALVVSRGSLSTQKFVLSRSIYSRVTEPLAYLRDETDFEIEFDLLSVKEITNENIKHYDVIVFCKHNTEDSLRVSKLAAENGIKIIYDIDDLIYRFTKDSLAFVHMKNVGYLKSHIESADVVVISTDTLAKVIEADFAIKKQVVIRTGINTDKYFKTDYAPSSSNVLFTNGDNIKVDTFRSGFIEVFNEFLKSNPAVQFDVFGDSEEYLKDLSRYNFLGSLPWSEHKEYLAKTQYEFAIIPLGSVEETEEHQLFSRCKTPIKYLEYGALKIPGIYSDAFIYSDVIRSGETALLVKNDAHSWKQALEEMHLNPSFRKRLADRAFEDVAENHHIKVAARRWAEVLATVCR